METPNLVKMDIPESIPNLIDIEINSKTNSLFATVTGKFTVADLQRLRDNLGRIGIETKITDIIRQDENTFIIVM